MPYAGKPEEINDDSEYVTGTDNDRKYFVEGLEHNIPKDNSSQQIISLFSIVKSIGVILQFFIWAINDTVSLIHFLDLLTLFPIGGSKSGSSVILLQISSKRKKVWLCPFMTSSYYLFWGFLTNFSRKFWFAHELLWFCRRATKKLKKKSFFFSNSLFCFLYKLFEVYIMLKLYIWFFFHLKSHFVIGILK